MTPWSNKTGVAKAVAIFATMLGIAVGLCGINFVSVLFFVPLGGPGPTGTPTLHDRLISALAGILLVASWIELAVIAISVAALIGLSVWSAISSIAIEKSDTTVRRGCVADCILVPCVWVGFGAR